MRRLLVAMDGSEPSQRALKLAADLAVKTNAEVTCAYVIAPPFYPPEAFYVPTAQLLDAERRLAEEVLAKACESVKSAGAPVTSALLRGPPAETLVALADESPEVEMVVVGSRGHNALSRVLLGSVADRVVHLSRKPVLVVR